MGPGDAGEDDTTASVLASAARGVQGPRTTSWGRALASPTPGRGRSNSHPSGQGTEVLGRPRQQVACRDSYTGGHLVLCICRDDIKKFPWFHPADGKKTLTFSAPSWGKSLGLAAAHAGAVLLSRCGCRCPAGWARVLLSGAPLLQTVTGKDASSIRSQHSEVGLGRGPACNPENSCSPRSKTLPCVSSEESLFFLILTEFKEKKAAHPGTAQQVSLCPGQAPTCDSKWERRPELEREWEGKGGDREMERDGDTQWGGGGDQGPHVLQTPAGSDLPRPLGTPTAVRRKRSVSPMGHVPRGPLGVTRAWRWSPRDLWGSLG